MDSFKFTNLNEIIESISYRANYHNIKVTNLDINGRYVHIEANKWIASKNDVVEFFRHVVSSVECAQNISKPMYVTNHICKEYYLDVEGDKIEINIIANERFDVNDYK